MNRCGPLWRAFILVAAGASLCLAQGIVEYGAGVGSRPAAGAASKIGDSVGNVLKRAGKNLENPGSATKGRPSPASTSAVARTSPPRSAPGSQDKPGIIPSPEAFAGLEVGASAAEVEAALGPPSFRIVVAEGGRLVETCHYSAKGRDIGTIRFVDGKVAELRPAGH
mgnify:CR=1 FL=1